MKKKKQGISEIMTQLLASPVGEKTKQELSGLVGGLSAELTAEEAMAATLIYKAIKGDTAAVKYVSELIASNSPPEKVEVVFRVVK